MPTESEVRIFTREDYDRLKKAQRRLHDLMPLCDKARAAGIEVDAFIGLCNHLASGLEALEREFMTPPPEI